METSKFINSTVKLRTKPIKNNRQSLYLDFYPPIFNPESGKLTRRYFLNKYIITDSENENDIETNEINKTLAENKLSEVRKMLAKGELSFFSNYKPKTNFIEYFEELANKNGDHNYRSTYKYLRNFSKGSIEMEYLSEKFCEDFKEYLLTSTSLKSESNKLSQNSAALYFSFFKSALKKAFKDNLLTTNLGMQIDPIKGLETQREYLTEDEFRLLVKTDCDNPLLKKAFLFSCMTGMRFSDIEKLTWNDIRTEKNNYAIHYRQKKTKSVEILPISNEVKSFLGIPDDPTNKIFKGLIYSTQLNVQLGKWIKAAGITKKILFHSGRHTFATLQLSLGIDLYTVSKLLGHKEIKTTQIYAKIIDKTKEDAANRMGILISTYIKTG